MASIIKVDQIQTAAGGTPTAADLGINTTGNVIQVVQGSTTTQNDINSTSAVTTNISASITPTSTSSKVLVLIDAPYRFYNTNGGGTWVRSSIYRNGSAVGDERHYECYIAAGSAIYIPGNLALKYLDSPATTSATTYELYAYINSSADSRRCTFQQDSRASTITLMEIAG